MNLNKNLFILIVGASTLHGCGHEHAASVTAEATDSVPATEVYRGTEDGTLCELTIEKDAKNQVAAMVYSSLECKGNNGDPCTIDFNTRVLSSFRTTPSVQFPGYTRIALNNLILPFPIAGLTMVDEFVIVKDSFTIIKAVARNYFLHAGTPAGNVNWTSECRDVKKVQ